MKAVELMRLDEISVLRRMDEEFSIRRAVRARAKFQRREIWQETRQSNQSNQILKWKWESHLIEERWKVGHCEIAMNGETALGFVRKNRQDRLKLRPELEPGPRKEQGQ